jgi:hypothetical protein
MMQQAYSGAAPQQHAAAKICGALRDMLMRRFGVPRYACFDAPRARRALRRRPAMPSAAACAARRTLFTLALFRAIVARRATAPAKSRLLLLLTLTPPTLICRRTPYAPLICSHAAGAASPDAAAAALMVDIFPFRPSVFGCRLFRERHATPRAMTRHAAAEARCQPPLIFALFFDIEMPPPPRAFSLFFAGFQDACSR